MSGRGGRASPALVDPRIGVAQPLQQRLLVAAILASFVSFLDGSIVTIALPAIARDVGGGVVTQQWVIDAYLLTVSALILVSGAVSDAFGRIRVLRIALLAFAATSVLCALAPTSSVLIVARLLQGVAGALLVPGALGLIIAVFSSEEEPRAIGRWTAWASVANLAGPVLGGVLVDAAGWRSVFLVALLPAAASMLLLGRTRDAARTTRASRVDVPSCILTAAGLGGLTVGLVELGSHAASDPALALVAVGALAIGVGCLAAFVVRDRRTAWPLVPPHLFRSRNFTAGNLSTFVIYAGLGLAFLVPSLFLQQVVGLKATVAALVSLPATVLTILLSGRFGALSGSFGPRRFMTIGPLIAASGAFTMTWVREPQTALWFVVPGMVLFGLGLSITVAPLTSAVLGAVPANESGIGSAVNNVVARTAGLLSTACVGWILAGPVSVPGFVRVEVAVMLLLLAGATISFLGIRDHRLAGAEGSSATRLDSHTV
ncbi:MAG TPA: MFS transporter [Amnibacterium sp.]|jgi:EmrB/QacA subfamily drug resistance transporter|uniref:MFS transporter n=1 Tax=Amnibacterium sp. TaxID=1872496 RepID=UPI002F9327E8